MMICYTSSNTTPSELFDWIAWLQELFDVKRSLLAIFVNEVGSIFLVVYLLSVVVYLVHKGKVFDSKNADLWMKTKSLLKI